MARTFEIDGNRVVESLFLDDRGQVQPAARARAAAEDGAFPLFVEMSRPATVTKGAPTVLLVHGASASSNTFKDPDGGLLRYLQEAHDCNVYTLDWRSSMRTVDRLIPAKQPTGKEPNRKHFTLDASVADLVAAIDYVQQHAGLDRAENIRIVGHCIGGALVAQAIAMGKCPARNVVLTTLALFFKVGVEGWVKGNDFVLDELLANRLNQHHVVSAKAATDERLKWPAELEERYQFWLDSGIHHGCGQVFCERVSFMYGMPFRVDDMRYLHDMAGGLESQFGSMPLGIYAHCLRNLRRGWAAPFETTRGDEYVDENARKRFAHRRVTLITGNENQVWHRNSMDIMYQWLTNGPKIEGVMAHKHVLNKYGHQDLYWSTNAKRDVYPRIAAGLLAPPELRKQR